MSILLAALGGAFLALAQPAATWLQPFAGSLWVLPGGMLLMAAADRAAPGWRTFAAGWIAGAVFFGILLHWLVHPLRVFPERDLWAAPFAVIGLPAALAVLWGLAFVGARLASIPGIARAITLAIALSIAEWLRSVVLGGFPWGLAGYVWIDTPLRNLLAYIGIHGLTLLTFLVPMLLWTLALGGNARVQSLLWRVAAGAALILAPLGAGLAIDRPAPAGTGHPVLRLVQPNIPQHEKWDSRYRSRNLQQLVTLSLPDGTPPPDILIWPEAAFPDITLRAEQGASVPGLELPFRALASQAMLLGMLTQDPEGRTFNSLVAVAPDGTQLGRYDKHHLVPFGEFVPLRRILGSLGINTLTRGGFETGPGPGRIALPGVGPVAALVCYEAIFGNEVRNAARDAKWILQITNDAWFGPAAGPVQHLAHARARAAELGLPLIRVANTGISAVIDASGRIRESLPLSAAGVLETTLPPVRPGTTVYARYGELPAMLMVLSLGLLVAGARLLAPRRTFDDAHMRSA